MTDGVTEPAARTEAPTPATLTEPHTPAVTRYDARPVFTGDGAEYFRIWVVNVLLTLLTLGVYSAWAKVRKAAYFRQNTRLDGHVFGYHANPGAILRGRVVAFVLFVAYSMAFQFSNVAGCMAVAALCAVGPWLFMKGLQFSLVNTSFRGVRFGFRAHAGEAYRTMLPILVFLLVPGALVLFTRWQAEFAEISSIAVMLAIPWIHHRLKAYQLRNACYGDRLFAFAGATGRFYAVSAKGFGLIFLMWAGLSTAGVLTHAPAAAPVVGTLIMFVLMGTYYVARIQQVVWNRTRLGDMRFRTDIAALPLFRLVLKAVTLTILTGGLYWPWAAVALARYRIQCVTVESEVPLAVLAAGVVAPPVSATGAGFTDAFGIDIGL